MVLGLVGRFGFFVVVWVGVVGVVLLGLLLIWVWFVGVFVGFVFDVMLYVEWCLWS